MSARPIRQIDVLLFLAASRRPQRSFTLRAIVWSLAGTGLPVKGLSAWPGSLSQQDGASPRLAWADRSPERATQPWYPSRRRLELQPMFMEHCSSSANRQRQVFLLGLGCERPVLIVREDRADQERLMPGGESGRKGCLKGCFPNPQAAQGADLRPCFNHLREQKSLPLTPCQGVRQPVHVVNGFHWGSSSHPDERWLRGLDTPCGVACLAGDFRGLSIKLGRSDLDGSFLWQVLRTPSTNATFRPLGGIKANAYESCNPLRGDLTVRSGVSEMPH